MSYDYLIVGTGQAGVPLAARLAETGKTVAIFEKGHLGGTCVNVGCTPTKAMIASARAAHVARTAGRLGVRSAEVEVDVRAVVERKRALVRRWRDRVSQRLASSGDRLRLVRGQARFESAHTVVANGDRFTGERVIINVGCRPARPEIAGLESVSWLDNDRAMELESLPPSLAVIGGGYIGCELGQMFRRFGAEVTILDHNRHLLSREDEEISSTVEDVFRGEGIELRLGAKVAQIRPGKGAAVSIVLAHGGEIEASHLLVATGRTPNTDDLGCDAAGIELDDRGFIMVDPRYRTSADEVYAVGDVTGGPQFTHSSWDDHRILLSLLEEGGGRTRDDRIVPYAVFTDPSVGRVGLSEREAIERGIEYEVATLPFGDVARAIETDETAGILKVLIDPRNERILGAAIVGLEAAELIHVFVAMMAAGTSARTLVDAEMIHPALAEGLQSVLFKFPRYS
jgi:pyruvate/2-oxoglutarate dehydrogenase complex dihydrolipoamide dehydrogenase (E3) component